MTTKATSAPTGEPDVAAPNPRWCEWPDTLCPAAATSEMEMLCEWGWSTRYLCETHLAAERRFCASTNGTHPWHSHVECRITALTD